MFAGMKVETLDPFAFEVVYKDDQLLAKVINSGYRGHFRFKGIPIAATIIGQSNDIVGNVENHKSEHATHTKKKAT